MIPANFNQLYYLWVAGEEGGITAAARRLGLTQSNLSHQIRQLEAFFGRPLLRRGRRGSVLTPAGARAVERARPLFAAADSLRETVREGVAPPPLLRLAASRTLGREHLLAAVRRVRRVAPGVRLRLAACAPEAAEELLARGECDAVLSDLAPSSAAPPRRRTALLASPRLGFYAAPAAALAAGPFPRALGRLPLLVRPAGSPARQEAERFMRSMSLRPTLAAEADDAGLLAELAAAGEGVCVLDDDAARPFVAAARLKRVARLPGAGHGVWLSWSGGKRDDAALAAALDALRGVSAPDA